METCANFESCGSTLYGILGIPGGEGSIKGCVVFVHGWSGCRCGPHRILVEAARNMNERGFATLRFDLSGRGESEGGHTDTGLDDMIEDTNNAVKFMRGKFPGAPLALWGICSGGNVAIGSGTMLPGITSIVAWSTLTFQTHRSFGTDARRTGSMFNEYLHKLVRVNTWKKFFSGAVNFKMVLHVLFGHFAGKGKAKKQEGTAERNLKDSGRDIMKEFSEYAGSVLFLYGGADAEGSSSRAIYERFCAEHEIKADFDRIAGSNHNFYSLEWKRLAIERSAGWIEKHIVS